MLRHTNHFTDMHTNESKAAAPLELVEKLKIDLTPEQKTLLQIMASDTKSISIAQIHEWLLMGGRKQILITLYAASGIFIDHEWYLKLPHHSESIPVLSLLKDLTGVETAQNIFGSAYKMSLFELSIQTKQFMNQDKTPSAASHDFDWDSTSYITEAIEKPLQIEDDFNPIKNNKKLKKNAAAETKNKLPKNFEDLTFAQLHQLLQTKPLSFLYRRYNKTYTQLNAQLAHLPHKYVKDFSTFTKLGNATVEEVQTLFGEYYHYPFQGLHKVIRQKERQLATLSRSTHFDQPVKYTLGFFDQGALSHPSHQPMQISAPALPCPKITTPEADCASEIPEQDLEWINSVIL